MWFNQERGWDHKAHTLHYFTDFIWNCMLAHEQVLKNLMRIGYQTLPIFLKGVHVVTQDYNALPSPYRIVSDTGASLDWFKFMSWVWRINGIRR